MSVDIGALLVGYAQQQEREAEAHAPDHVAETILLAQQVRARRRRRALAIVGGSVTAVLLGSAVAYGLAVPVG